GHTQLFPIRRWLADFCLRSLDNYLKKKPGLLQKFKEPAGAGNKLLFIMSLTGPPLTDTTPHGRRESNPSCSSELNWGSEAWPCSVKRHKPSSCWACWP